MTKLEQAREEINKVDKMMAELFEKRMNLVVQIADYKKKNNMPVFDSSRENQVVERCTAYIKNPAFKSYYVKFIHGMMDISKEYEQNRIDAAVSADSQSPQ